MKIGHWEIIAKTGELYWSDEVYLIHGLKVGSKIDVDTAIGAYHPDDREKVVEFVRRALEEKENFQFTLRITKSDGDLRHVLATGIVRLLPDGEVRTVFGIFEDITERVQSEQKLLQKEAQLNHVQKLGHIGNWTQNLETKEVIWSDEQYRIFGYMPGEITASLDVVKKAIHPEDQDGFKKTYKAAIESKETNYSHEYRIIRPDGNVRYLRSIVEIKRDDYGNAYNLNGIYQDITEQTQKENARLEAEQRFEAIVNNSPSSIVLKDLDGKYQIVNKQWDEWVNPEGLDMIGKTVHDIYPIDHANEVAAHDDEVIRSGIPSSKEYFTPKADGSMMQIVMQKFPVKNNDGKTVGVGTINTDISEFKKLSNLLNEAIESLSEGFALYDQEDRLVLMNSKYKEFYKEHAAVLMIGRTFESMLREAVAAGQFIGAKGMEENWILERMEAHRNPTKPIDQQLPGGRWLRILETRTPSGYIAGLRVDVSEYKRVEEARSKNEALVNALIEHSPVAVSIKDLEGRYVFVSPTLAKYLHTTADNVISKPAGNFLDLDALSKVAKADEQVKKSGLAMRLDEAFPVKFGEATLLITKFPIMSEKEELIGIGTIGIDVTAQKIIEDELRKSEARLSGILEIAPEGVITASEDMMIILFNQGAERIFGYQAKEVIGKPLEILMPHRSRTRHAEYVQEFNQSRDNFRLMDDRQEIYGLRKNGVEFPAAASVSKLETETEKLFTVVVHDNTERKRAEKDIHKAKSEAEIANQAKSQFLASMSHELRTPLNAILGFSDIIRQQFLGPLGTAKYGEYADDIHSSGEHLLSLVNDLLDISAIEAGKLSITKMKLSAGELVTDCITTVRRNAAEKEIKLEQKIPEQPVSLYADRRAIKQVLLNLLSNALRYTPEKGKIKVSVKASKENVVFTVSDTGSGIPPELIQNLTEPFTRAEQDPHKATQGWGLGLAITKSLIDLHDGKLDIKSKVGKGTSVSVMIPNMLQ